MKTVSLCVLVIFAIVASARACGTCPPQRNAVCGFDRTCLYEFNNPCELTRYNCLKGRSFRATNRNQCESARNGSNKYPYCRINSALYAW